MSFVSYDADCPFPIQNLPYGVFKNSAGEQHIGVAIGDRVLDLHRIAEAELFSSPQVAEALKTAREKIKAMELATEKAAEAERERIVKAERLARNQARTARSTLRTSLRASMICWLIIRARRHATRVLRIS